MAILATIQINLPSLERETEEEKKIQSKFEKKEKPQKNVSEKKDMPLSKLSPWREEREKHKETRRKKDMRERERERERCEISRNLGKREYYFFENHVYRGRKE